MKGGVLCSAANMPYSIFARLLAGDTEVSLTKRAIGLGPYSQVRVYSSGSQTWLYCPSLDRLFFLVLSGIANLGVVLSKMVVPGRAGRRSPETPAELL